MARKLGLGSKEESQKDKEERERVKRQ